MATQRQIDANRRNAQKSTGPKTVAGKAKVAQNGRKHGFRAKVFAQADPQTLLPLQEFLKEALRPLGQEEEALVLHLAQAAWQIKTLQQWERTRTEGDYQDLTLSWHLFCRYESQAINRFLKTLMALITLQGTRLSRGIPQPPPRVTSPKVVPLKKYQPKPMSQAPYAPRYRPGVKKMLPFLRIARKIYQTLPSSTLSAQLESLLDPTEPLLDRPEEELHAYYYYLDGMITQYRPENALEVLVVSWLCRMEDRHQSLNNLAALQPSLNNPSPGLQQLLNLRISAKTAHRSLLAFWNAVGEARIKELEGRNRY